MKDIYLFSFNVEVKCTTCALHHTPEEEINPVVDTSGSECCQYVKHTLCPINGLLFDTLKTFTFSVFKSVS